MNSIKNKHGKHFHKGAGRFPKRESFFAQGCAYAELRRIEQLCEAGKIDADTGTPTSKLHLPIAVAIGPLSSSAYAVLMAEAIRTA